MATPGGRPLAMVLALRLDFAALEHSQGSFFADLRTVTRHPELDVSLCR
jgi:hypothetical protein